MRAKKILIIDDDAELSEELAEVLGAEGYPVENISDGFRAVKMLEKNGYDIVLLDFKMQGITGLDILKEIRAKSPSAAVFFVSGKPGLDAILEEADMAAAVDAIIEKPFDPQTLLDRINAC